MGTIHQIFLVLAYIVAIGFVIIGIDDLFLDLGFIYYLFRHRKRPILQVQELKNKPEQWIAVFIPAWKEGDIVNHMAEFAVKVLLYEKYDIFIGVYPNDAETCSCVDKWGAMDARIHKCTGSHACPTSNADCLNWQ